MGCEAPSLIIFSSVSFIEDKLLTCYSTVNAVTIELLEGNEHNEKRNHEPKDSEIMPQSGQVWRWLGEAL